MRPGVLLLMLAGLLPGLAVAAEKLGPDGFPADWTPEDLKPKMLVPAARDAAPASVQGLVSASLAAAPVVKVKPGLPNYGPLSTSNGGEAESVWQGAPRDVQQAALERATQDGLASPVLKEAWRRLLLSQAVAPPGGISGTNWLGVRAEALEDLGLYEAAWSLWKQVPIADSGVEDGLLYGAVKARMLAGDAVNACRIAKQKAASVAAYDKRWPVVVAACQMIVTNEKDPSATMAGASLSLQLVEQVLRAQNPALLKILSAARDGKAVTSGVPRVDALGGAVLAHYPALVGADVLPKLPDLALRRLVESQSLPLDLRARAAVSLATQTHWPQDGIEAWSLVSDTLVSDSAPVVRYAAWPDAMIVARGLPVVDANISSSVVLARDGAAAYVRAALRSGDAAAAEKGWALWTRDGLKGDALAGWWEARMAEAILHGHVEPEMWGPWLAAQELNTQAGSAQAQRTLLVADALGVGVPGTVWQALRDKALPVAGVLDPAWQHLLEARVAARDLPGTLGLVSEAWRQDAGDHVAPPVVGQSVAALRTLGQADVARRLAMEALLGVKENVYVARPGAVAQVAPAVRPAAMGDTLSGRGGIEGTMLPPPRVRTPSRPLAPVPPKM